MGVLIIRILLFRVLSVFLVKGLYKGLEFQKIRGYLTLGSL